MKFFRILLSRRISPALLRYNMDKDRFILNIMLCMFKDLNEVFDFMSIERSCICKTDFFKQHIRKHKILNPVFKSFKRVAYAFADKRDFFQPSREFTFEAFIAFACPQF